MVHNAVLLLWHLPSLLVYYLCTWVDICLHICLLSTLAAADFNNDGFLRLDELKKLQGIEKKIFDDVLEDAGALQCASSLTLKSASAVLT